MLLLYTSTLAAQHLVDLDRHIQRAMVADERPILRRYIAKDFRFTHSDGSIETKADVLRTAAMRPRYYLGRRVVHASAEVHGQIGFVYGSLEVASGRTPGDPPGIRAVCYSLHYVHSYEIRNGRWQLMSHRTTKITKPERPCKAIG